MTQQILKPTLPTNDIDSTDIWAFYSVECPNEVTSLLAASPRLAALLRELPEQVRRVFGSDRPLRLRISTDPEYPRESEIVVYISTEATSAAALADAERRIRQLHSEWLIHLPREYTRTLNLEVE